MLTEDYKIINSSLRKKDIYRSLIPFVPTAVSNTVDAYFPCVFFADSIHLHLVDAAKCTKQFVSSYVACISLSYAEKKYNVINWFLLPAKD